MNVKIVLFNPPPAPLPLVSKYMFGLTVKAKTYLDLTVEK